MPSFRVVLTLGDVRGGVDPSSILPRAAASARELTVVEAFDVSVVSGTARITVRFTAEDAELALQIGHHVASSLTAFAIVTDETVTERVSGRWYVVGQDR